MHKFISILISFILIGIADNIDDFFNNSLSIDAIVVCGCIFTIDIILNAISHVGVYAYRTARKNESAYLIINVISALLLSFIVFSTREYIVNIFDLTINQKEMLSNVLAIYIFYLTAGRTSNAIFEMIRLKGNLKLYNKSLLLFYICLILFDIIAFKFTHNLIMLFVATTVSWIISIIYMLYKLKLKFMLPTKEEMKNIKVYAIPTLFERIITCGSVLIYTIVATHLGTHSYAIYTVCFAVMVHLEIITDAYQAALMIKVPLSQTYEKQHDVLIGLKKQCFKIALIFNYVLCLIYLFISHGSLPMQDCFPYILLFASAVWSLYPYETYKTLCIAQGKTTIMLQAALIGTTISIILYLVFLHTDYALIVFGLAGIIEFGIKTIIVKYLLNKEYKIKASFD